MGSPLTCGARSTQHRFATKWRSEGGIRKTGITRVLGLEQTATSTIGWKNVWANCRLIMACTKGGLILSEGTERDERLESTRVQHVTRKKNDRASQETLHPGLSESVGQGRPQVQRSGRGVPEERRSACSAKNSSQSHSRLPTKAGKPYYKQANEISPKQPPYMGQWAIRGEGSGLPRRNAPGGGSWRKLSTRFFRRRRECASGGGVRVKKKNRPPVYARG